MLLLQNKESVPVVAQSSALFLGMLEELLQFLQHMSLLCRNTRNNDDMGILIVLTRMTPSSDVMYVPVVAATTKHVSILFRALVFVVHTMICNVGS